ncbi:DUF1330 domain-containing protein [Bradyrhizobium sp. RD5-C2]|uniref:DUF1330 domain-containing protein n=1 Tax=Bradyrhizobium sp. RD5-C2 TaxID=244562 RepID=UPI001CC3BC7D|nr:DUF1330 domain-containing protein [Bradyrhizobium sp. RD5-C2]GIQ73081.1 hypothetical protein BraRD5C2_15180 [Bradyrhizobium sp. RD5-C2]
MTVYVIALVKFTQEEYYRRYQSRFADVFKAFNGRLLAADERPKVLDGKWTRDKVVIMEFPDEAEATRFLGSPAYQEISRDRIAGATVLSLLVKGLP